MSDDDPPLSPPIDLDRPPPFHEMNTYPKRFERLTRDLMEVEPDLHRAALFGIDGEGQFGIDAIAELITGSGVDVASSKCQRRVEPSEIVKWSNDFLDHWDAEWKDRGVRRFILAVAAENIDQVSVRKARTTEALRFSEFGLDYVVWGPAELEQRLRKDRALTRRRLGDAWAQLLCGHDPAQVALLQAVEAGQAAAIQVARAALADQAQARVAAAIDDLACGLTERATTAAARLRDPATWALLSPAVQGAVARLEGRVAFFHEDRAAARRFSDEAMALDPTERRLAALLCDTPADALATLGPPVTLLDRQAEVMHLFAGGAQDQAQPLLDAVVAEAPEDPETLRLLGWRRLWLDDRAGAIAAITVAERVAPQRLGILRMGAVTRYALAVSPRLDIGRLVRPHVIPPIMVRGDDESRRCLEGALERIDAATQRSAHLEDRLWKLALCCLLGRRADAQETLDEILDREPGETLALGWAQMHGLAFDAGAARAALREKLRAGLIDANDIQVLVDILNDEVGPPATADEVERALDAAPPEQQASLRAVVRALRDHPQDGDDDEEYVILPELSDDSAEVDWASLEARLARLFGEEKPGLAAFYFAGKVAERGRWTALAPYAELIASYETTESVRLALHVVHFTRSAAAFLEFLGRHVGAFPTSGLPRDIRRLQSLALQTVGRLQEALSVAESLAVETGAREDRLNLIQLHLGSGLVSAALPWIRRAFDADQLRAGDAIRFSVAVAGQDREFARELWRFAVAAGVPDRYLINAYAHGYNLGLDAEVGPLTLRMRARAAAGADDVWEVDDVQDVVDHMLRRREESERVAARLDAGAVAVHLALGALDSLVRIYRLDRPGRKGPLGAFYVRHGGRPLGSGPKAPWREWRIHLDITGLLIADQLDLLRFMEALDAPIKVSPHLVDCLYQLRDQAVSAQPSYVEAAREVLKALDDSRVRLAGAEPFAEAVTVRPEADRDGDATGPTSNDVVETLRRLGDLGRDIDLSDPTVLPVEPNSLLLFEDDTLLDLAVGGVLEPVLVRFQCRISEATEVELRQRVRTAEDQAELAARITRLRERVASGLQNGVYERTELEEIPVADDADEEEPGGAPPGPFAGSLVDILKSPGVPNGVLWVDDRYVSGFARSEGNLIVGVVEVLEALEAAKLVTPEGRRQKLRMLRAGGALFIPMTADEVLAPLRMALMRNGQLIETPDLTILRRSFAAGMLADRHLKLGETDDPLLQTRPDEAQYLFAMGRLADACLVAVWSEPGTSLELRRARADWIWTNLRMAYGVPTPRDDATDDATTGLAAFGLAASLANATSILTSKTAGSLARQGEYLNWLGDVAISPSDKEGFLDIVAEQFRELLSFDASRRTPAQVQALREVRQLQTDLLPPPIRERVLAHPAYADAIGMGVEAVQSFGTTTFRHEVFWRALARALRTGKATVRTRDGARVTLTVKDDAVVCSGGMQATLREPFFAVLKAQPESRAAAIEDFAQKFDLAPGPLARFETAMRTARGDAGRADALVTAQRESVLQTYRNLSQVLQRPNPPKVSDFRPPAATSMAHHLRLGTQTDGGFTERVAAAWATLKAKVGPRFAFQRLAGLPVDLGAILAGESDAPALVAEWSGRATPMARLHLARAARLLGLENLADENLAALIAMTPVEMETFCAMLDWTEVAYTADPEWWSLGAAERLAVVWAHTEFAFGAIASVQPTSDSWQQMRQSFEQYRLTRTIGCALARDGRYEGDASAPALMSARALLYHGLGYVLGEEPALDRLTEDQKALVTGLMIVEEDGAFTPSLSVLLRHGAPSNLLGGFLDQRPTLFDVDLDPAVARERRTETSLAAVEQDSGCDRDWAVLATYAKAGLEPAYADRLVATFGATNFRDQARSERGPALCRVAISARRCVGPPVEDEVLHGKIREMGAALADLFPTASAVNSTDGQARFSEALEALGASAAMPTPNATLDRLEEFAVTLAGSWPAAAGLLRSALDNIARHSGVVEGRHLWQGFVALQTFP